ncbi:MULTISPECIES: aminotransferase class V-fold PLP-dependent enzyme [unclassified Arthrobacter]|uniref:kynureninase n=1 Tax=unclassified Arthrobacter TaxID=235627 RepID=UPI001E620F9E|nr:MULTISPECIES: aminotransferase class V-fold PLP-dependent enzyme [unclassified Arthrobacter]MCC9145414.1 aminotransferase class V-fold PLP-dependent enzyme [Arthrobacter sp. zg-Y919]MDK1276642.1 aminotransferase class V-fold PLP-dependent enzyme [Arthrobacter sp. zg.Y919]MDM7989281.1 aminotransferase class V-fold PLP-dependent enzyme [Arthrobacter sp. zg-Y877]WIB04409.1 aminotransferase class V-fold PLP-dependent enzyme [Arthrobacter sp. zg-Y919]
MIDAAGLLVTAKELDAADPLAGYRDRFLPADGVRAYLDGNSLGRPLRATAENLQDFVTRQWGGRLIRGWDEQWLELPGVIGDQLGEVALGAAPGQCIVADSTTVLLYKLARAAVAARPGRTEILLDADNFPTDRYVLEGVARECGLTLRWVPAGYAGGVTAEAVADAVGPQTALAVFSHVAYRSGYLADAAAINNVVHDAGGLVLWDLCHSVGVVPAELDADGTDYAVGCSYKYLNGGPGAPAWAYVAARHQEDFSQPIQGWLGSDDPFGMAQGYVPATGIRRLVSGTPPILGMLAMQDMIALIREAGMAAVRAKSQALTEYAVTATDALLAPRGVVLASPRDPDRRGSHITVDHPKFKAATAALWKQGIIPDYRNPDGIRLGLSPLSTSFTETFTGIEAILAEL